MSLPPSERSRLAFLRATAVLWSAANPDLARARVDQVELPDDPDSQAIVAAVHAACDACTGRPQDAARWFASTRSGQLLPIPAAVALWGAIVAHGDLGDDDRAGTLYAEAKRVVDSSPDASHMRFVITDAIVDTYIKAGRIREAAVLSQELGQLAQDMPGAALVMAAGINGLALIANGMLAHARGALDFVVGTFRAFNERNGFSYRYQLPRIVTLALTGATSEAKAAWEELPGLLHPSWANLEPDRLIAGAWVAATTGVLSEARTLAREAGTVAAARGQLSREVVALQTLAQLGDSSEAARAAVLAEALATPRAQAVAGYVAALSAKDGESISAAAHQLSALGDQIGAMDAHAQAAVAFRNAGLRGSAVLALDAATTLAGTCGCANTPALIEATISTPLSDREREIIALVAEGLSNRDIADRLGLSVRTVEGHLYRASQRTGATTRAELTALLHTEF